MYLGNIYRRKGHMAIFPRVTKKCQANRAEKKKPYFANGFVLNKNESRPLKASFCIPDVINIFFIMCSYESKNGYIA